MAAPSLRNLAIEHGTDKQGAHAYADRYEQHLGHLRERAITLLEIGIGGYADPLAGGQSLRMWKAFFPRARIVGLDLHDKSALAEERIEIVQGDQSDAEFLAALGRRLGPFDVVIDDGSHVNSHVIASFCGLFPYVAEDGIYAIEDLQTSYWERPYGGSSGEDRSGTSMSFLHGLVDGLNYAEFDIAGYVPTAFDRGIDSITFYHNLAFVQRGQNLEPSNFLPPHPRTRTFYRQVVPAAVSVSSDPRRTASTTESGSRRLARTLLPRSIRGLLRRLLRRRSP